jgi:hypothetical protein
MEGNREQEPLLSLFDSSEDDIEAQVPGQRANSAVCSLVRVCPRFLGCVCCLATLCGAFATLAFWTIPEVCPPGILCTGFCDRWYVRYPPLRALGGSPLGWFEHTTSLLATVSLWFVHSRRTRGHVGGVVQRECREKQCKFFMNWR